MLSRKCYPRELTRRGTLTESDRFWLIAGQISLGEEMCPGAVQVPALDCSS
jgi:hypothetical protein